MDRHILFNFFNKKVNKRKFFFDILRKEFFFGLYLLNFGFYKYFKIIIMIVIYYFIYMMDFSFFFLSRIDMSSDFLFCIYEMYSYYYGFPFTCKQFLWVFYDTRHFVYC